MRHEKLWFGSVTVTWQGLSVCLHPPVLMLSAQPSSDTAVIKLQHSSAVTMYLCEPQIKSSPMSVARPGADDSSGARVTPGARGLAQCDGGCRMRCAALTTQQWISDQRQREYNAATSRSSITIWTSWKSSLLLFSRSMNTLCPHHSGSHASVWSYFSQKYFPGSLTAVMRARISRLGPGP